MRELNGWAENMDAGSAPVRLDSPRAWRTYLGGALLDELHGKEHPENSHFPEEWIMSVVAARNAGREEYEDEGMSHIYGSKETLKSYLDRNGEACLGKEHTAVYGASTGVLTKLIDSAERLTIQVHPDERDAMRLFHSPYGKTECWHILGGREIDGESPCIYLGFRPGIARERWKHLFEVQDIPGMLNAMHRFEVKPGDTILIRGGMPHAIGAGCFLAEIQEPTDFTIRVERTTPSGFPVDDFLCHQGLGFEKMFDAFHYDGMTAGEVRQSCFIASRELVSAPGGGIRTLVGYDFTPLFRLDEIRARGALTVPDDGRFSGLYVLEGQGRLLAGETELPLEKASQFFLPRRTGAFTVEASPEKPLRLLHFFGRE